MKIEELNQWISKAGKTQRIVEVPYPFLSDFHVSVAYASKFVLNQIREACREVYTNRRTGAQEERMNEAKLRTEYSRQILRGWKGLDVEKLDKLVPGTLEEAELAIKEAAKKKEEKSMALEQIKAIEVEFSHETGKTIMDNSIEFENWVIDQATNVENFSKIAKQKEKEYSNL